MATSAMQGAELYIVPELQKLRASAYITPNNSHNGEWDDVTVSAPAVPTPNSTWTGYVTDDPRNSNDIADYNDAYPTLPDAARIKGWSLIVPIHESAGGASEERAGIEGVAVNGRRSPLDIQKLVADLAFASWRSGTFEVSFPELARVTRDKRSIVLAELPSELAQREKAAGRALKIAEVDIRADSLPRIGAAYCVPGSGLCVMSYAALAAGNAAVALLTVAQLRASCPLSAL